MEPVRFAVLIIGTFFLAFGLAAYRYFHTVLGATAGLALWIISSDTLIQLPGLKEHPGTAALMLLILMVLAGVLLASKFRKLLIFSSGMCIGLILSRTFEVFMADGTFSGLGFSLSSIDPMDILAGLVCGGLCLIFERFFAVVLTSIVGAYMCSWAIGGSWTFPACLAIGLVAQPLIFSRFKSVPPASEKRGTGTRIMMVFLLFWLIPSAAFASWILERINAATSRVVVLAGDHDLKSSRENIPQAGMEPGQGQGRRNFVFKSQGHRHRGGL